MKHKTNRVTIKIIITIVIVSIAIAVAIMVYKYFGTLEELVNYKNKYEEAMLKLEETDKDNVRNEGIIKESIEDLTKEELKEKLIEYKSKYEETMSKLEETIKKLEEYKKHIANNLQDTRK